MFDNESIAVNVTPAGIPVVGALVILALFALSVWDALRLPAGLWFRWFIPVGFIPFLVGANFDIIWLMLAGTGVMAIGFGMSKSWRQKNSANWF
ncbi:hypothetical protein [Streptomyces cathayae]|uniref:DUF2637 domain-containing protein n=1 Tax=Streptomyces cathayae TaxID=3031124 RepID=A0ABY8JWV7_9ACTN|nr:hypothetical protein [Streptomyces sp. HUAS 5]WGD40489.1 hypothetical protein PYS65_10240 [Streptomyces sp. HUAS 5]